MSAGEDFAEQLRALQAVVERQGRELAETRHALALVEDRNAIERLQYAYGYFIDNRMFREVLARAHSGRYAIAPPTGSTSGTGVPCRRSRSGYSRSTLSASVTPTIAPVGSRWSIAP